MKRITQKDLSIELGLHVSTVSKALKGDPAIAKGTRKRVLAKANELGFKPDPMLSALATYRRRSGRPEYRSTIGWICNHPRETDMKIYAGYEEYLKGAKERSEALGYSLEPFWVDGRRSTMESLPRILRARGIKALIFAPQVESGTVIDFPVWDFCTLAIGYSLAGPLLDIVTNDHFSTMTDLLGHLKERGYCRIGCYLWEIDNERMGRRARSALMAFSKEYSVDVRTYREFRPTVFRNWIQTNHYDAVVGRGIKEWDALNGLESGRREGIGYAGYSIGAEETMISGMNHRNYHIGVRAVEWVCSKLERGQFGLPISPERLLISGRWLENESA